VTKGVSSKQQREDRLRLQRRERAQAAQALPTAAKVPPRAIKVPSAAKRLSGSRSVSPLDRRDK
jgi:hypothetical protein